MTLQYKTSNLEDLLVDFFGEPWEEDINDMDVNDNDFLSEPEDEFQIGHEK